MPTTTTEPEARQMFMVVGTIRQDTDFDELAARRADEHRQLMLLQSQGKVGAHHLSFERMTVFLEVFATDRDDCAEILASLPFRDFFDPDAYPISSPPAS